MFAASLSSSSPPIVTQEESSDEEEEEEEAEEEEEQHSSSPPGTFFRTIAKVRRTRGFDKNKSALSGGCSCLSVFFSGKSERERERAYV